MLRNSFRNSAARTYTSVKTSARALIFRHAVKAYWWDSEPNFGDLVTWDYLAARSKKRVVNVNGATINLGQAICGAGSILQSLSYPNVIVWGSGFITQDVARPACAPVESVAYRGPRSARIAASLGWPAARTLGDPGLLVPRLYPRTDEVRYRVGIVPHIAHTENTAGLIDRYNDIKVIPAGRSVQQVAIDIQRCEAIISSSLHGIIVALAYGIPAVWIAFPEVLKGGDFKFNDFFESLNLHPTKVSICSGSLNRAEALSMVDDAISPDLAQIASMGDKLERSLDGVLPLCAERNSCE